LSFLSAKLAEHRITPALVEVREGERLDRGPFALEFLAVNHSIPDGLPVAVRTRAGLVLHTGDFKMDQFPLDRRITDLRGFARLGEEAVDLLLMDSTNADVPGFTTSERELAPAIETVFRSTRWAWPRCGGHRRKAARFCTPTTARNSRRGPPGSDWKPLGSCGRWAPWVTVSTIR
jgi:mRNA degradation ribonuclease J1/J2